MPMLMLSFMMGMTYLRKAISNIFGIMLIMLPETSLMSKPVRSKISSLRPGMRNILE